MGSKPQQVPLQQGQQTNRKGIIKAPAAARNEELMEKTRKIVRMAT